MGSNMAECHPVGFQWVVEAQARGAHVVHVDPRFTRTSALADSFVRIRAGTDIAFLGGVIRYVLEHDRMFHEYVVHYTNAAAIVGEEFVDTEDLDGLFSGFDEDTHTYDPSTWQYAGEHVAMAAAGQRSRAEAGGADATGDDGTGEGDEASGAEESGGMGAEMAGGEAPHRDPTLQHPRCVFQILKRHFARYTPEMVARTCGVPADQFERVCELLCERSGREQTTAFVYSVGWTQHTTGAQIIRAASILQLLLGNIGRPGGGILALRGHASIQGSTDIPTLYDLLPGYLPMPVAGSADSLDSYIEAHSSKAGFWGHMEDYLVSLLTAWWGDAARAADDSCFDLLPRISGDHSTYRTAIDMVDGKVDGFFLFGQNPAVGSANSKLHRRALAALDWLVVRDLNLIESATFWANSPEVRNGEMSPGDIATEVFFLPAAGHAEKDGTFTNTQRLLQWHDAAYEPTGDRRSDLWFTYHLGRRIRALLARSDDPRDRGVLDLTWDYPTEGDHAEPSADAVLREINGWDADGEPLSSYTQLRSDGSTTAGCWIYTGVYRDGVNQARRRRPGHEQSWVAQEWAWAWPDDRRLLYNRASADPEGRPWSERKRYVWWDAEAGRWTGEDTPDFVADLPPDHEPGPHAEGSEAIRGDSPFIMQADGKGWLLAPAGLKDGPLPTHYEPHESPVPNPLHGQSANPARIHHDHPLDPTPDDLSGYPFVLTTYRLTEHHTAGGMSRWVSRLSELQPEMFCEVDPELAARRGLEHLGWAVISSPRGAIEARVLVTERMQPVQVDGRTVHQVGLPYHWGYEGSGTTGASANDLFHLTLDPNVEIQEVKAAVCDIRPGRQGER